MSALNVRVTQQQLAEAVAWVAKRAATLTTTPILGGILIEAAGDNLNLTAADHNESGRATIPAIIQQEGRALVSARLLERITSALNRTAIGLADNGSGRLTVTAGTGEFTLPLLPVDEYPELPAMPALIGEVDAAAWAAGVKAVEVASAGRDAAPHWLGDILIQPGDALTLVATNRWQLATVDLPWQPALGEDAEPVAIQVNAALLADHAKAAKVGTVQLHYQSDMGTLGLTSPGRQSTLRLSVPEWNTGWRRLVPNESPLNVTVDAAELEAILRRAAALNDMIEATVRLYLTQGQMQIVGEAAAAEHGIGNETLAVDYNQEDVQFRAKIVFLRDALAQAGNGRAHIGLSSSRGPATVRRLRDDGTPDLASTHLVMPVKFDAPAVAPAAKRRAA
jgi:DNA polymerase-3 subunit beta